MNKLYINKLWIKELFNSSLEDISQYIQEWNDILTNKLNKDKLRIEQYNGNEYGDAYTNLITYYNPLYASLLISIYSALEYDLSRLLSLQNFNFKCFKCKLKSYKIDVEKLKYWHDINTLRSYCNAYKHNNGKLKNINCNDIIEYISIDILECYYRAYQFLDDIYTKVNLAQKAK